MLRYRLLTLFALITICAVGFAWLNQLLYSDDTWSRTDTFLLPIHGPLAARKVDAWLRTQGFRPIDHHPAFTLRAVEIDGTRRDRCYEGPFRESANFYVSIAIDAPSLDECGVIMQVAQNRRTRRWNRGRTQLAANALVRDFAAWCEQVRVDASESPQNGRLPDV